MRPFGGALLAHSDLMSFRGSTKSGSSSSAAKPSGVAVGDLVVVLVTDYSGLTISSGGGAWARTQIDWISLGYHSVAFAKILNATDVANAWSFSTTVGDSLSLAWIAGDAGGVTIHTPATNPASQSTLTLSGFTPANTQGVIAVAIDRDTDLTAGNPGTPTGFINRFRGAVDTNWTMAVADMDAYVGGNVVWTGMDTGASDFAEVGILIEVTGP